MSKDQPIGGVLLWRIASRGAIGVEVHVFMAVVEMMEVEGWRIMNALIRWKPMLLSCKPRPEIHPAELCCHHQ